MGGLKESRSVRPASIEQSRSNTVGAAVGGAAGVGARGGDFGDGGGARHPDCTWNYCASSTDQIGRAHV